MVTSFIKLAFLDRSIFFEQCQYHLTKTLQVLAILRLEDAGGVVVFKYQLLPLPVYVFFQSQGNEFVCLCELKNVTVKYV